VSALALLELLSSGADAAIAVLEGTLSAMEPTTAAANAASYNDSATPGGKYAGSGGGARDARGGEGGGFRVNPPYSSASVTPGGECSGSGGGGRDARGAEGGGFGGTALPNAAPYSSASATPGGESKEVRLQRLYAIYIYVHTHIYIYIYI